MECPKKKSTEFSKPTTIAPPIPILLTKRRPGKSGTPAAQYLKRNRQNLPASLQVKMEDTLVVGHDMRPHSPSLSKALCDGIRSVRQ